MLDRLRSTSVGAVRRPAVAAPFALALSKKAAWPAPRLASFPPHALRAEACSALPKENDSLHGLHVAHHVFTYRHIFLKL